MKGPALLRVWKAGLWETRRCGICLRWLLSSSWHCKHPGMIWSYQSLLDRLSFSLHSWLPKIKTIHFIAMVYLSLAILGVKHHSGNSWWKKKSGLKHRLINPLKKKTTGFIFNRYMNTVQSSDLGENGSYRATHLHLGQPFPPQYAHVYPRKWFSETVHKSHCPVWDQTVKNNWSLHWEEDTSLHYFVWQRLEILSAFPLTSGAIVYFNLTDFTVIKY